MAAVERTFTVPYCFPACHTAPCRGIWALGSYSDVEILAAKTLPVL